MKLGDRLLLGQPRLHQVGKKINKTKQFAQILRFGNKSFLKIFPQRMTDLINLSILTNLIPNIQFKMFWEMIYMLMSNIE